MDEILYGVCWWNFLEYVLILSAISKRFVHVQIFLFLGEKMTNCRTSRTFNNELTRKRKKYAQDEKEKFVRGYHSARPNSDFMILGACM